MSDRHLSADRERLIDDTHRRHHTPSRPAVDDTGRHREAPSRRLDRLREQLSPAQSQALNSVAQFRVVSTDALLQFVDGLSRHALRDLIDSNLLRTVRVAPEKIGRPKDNAERLQVVVLTARGASAVRTLGYDTVQHGPVRHGFKKPREALHDARLFAMAEIEKRTIEASGGRVTAIRTDTELKMALYRAERQYAISLSAQEAKQRAAEEFMITLLNEARYVIPDVRIEYDTREGERTRLDLELMSDTYSHAARQTKIGAGFKPYSVSRSGAVYQGTPRRKGKSVRDDHDYLKEILSR